jgi:hypothetical protein
MALGNLTYKTPVKIALIGENLTDKAGYIVSLPDPNGVELCTSVATRPYGVIVVGCDSLTPGTYPSQIAAGALEIVDAYGAVVVAMAGGTGVTFGSAVEVVAPVVGPPAVPGGTLQDVTGGAGDWIVGYALSSAAAGESFLLSFTPAII